MTKKDALDICTIELSVLASKMLEEKDIVRIALYESFMLDIVKHLFDMEVIDKEQEIELIGIVYSLYTNRRK